MWQMLNVRHASKHLKLHGGNIISQCAAVSYRMAQQYLFTAAPQQTASTKSNMIHTKIYVVLPSKWIISNNEIALFC